MPTVSETVAEQVIPLAERAARRAGCQLAYARYVRESGGWVLRIVIDRNGGVSVEDCANVSRQLSAMLDVDDLIPNPYNLEVSSPGLDEELLVARDYERFKGRAVRVETEGAVDGRTTFRGTLRGLTGGLVLIEGEQGESWKVPFKQVREARLEVEI